MNAREVNFDAIVGPTHNYAGLSLGNVASLASRGSVSSPREAALQGLAKMKALAHLGVPQAVLPPQERPDVGALRRLGFSGSDARVLEAARRKAPELLAACSSASAMWAANAATVSPSADSADKRVHLAVANLAGKLHRSIEPPQTVRTLRAIFSDAARFAVHEPVPSAFGIGDEGGANHARLAPSHGERGVHLFVHGHCALDARAARDGPGRFPSRQALEASEAVARLNLLAPETVVFARQNPRAIDAGVFHNDVISVGNENLFLHHEHAFAQTRPAVAALRRTFAGLGAGDLMTVEVPARRVPLGDAVRSYLFNSQIVTLEKGRMALIAPIECSRHPRVRAFVEDLLRDGQTPIREARYFNLTESMRNGGGPACLRLRVVLTDAEFCALPPGVVLSEAAYEILTAWVKKRYREKLAPADLADPALLEESRRALDELTRFLGLGPIYPFQGAG